VSNLDKDERVFERDNRTRLFGLGNRLWHSDSSFKPIPAKYSLLHAHSIPSRGGNTEFADMRAAWDALDPETQATCEGLICEHSQLYSRQILGFTDFTDEERARFAPVRQVLVRTHPVTGRKSLYLASHAGTIVGWPMPEARAFLRDLNEHATQRQFVSHRWQVSDLVMWDNRQICRVLPDTAAQCGYGRDRPTVAQPADAPALVRMQRPSPSRSQRGGRRRPPRVNVRLHRDLLRVGRPRAPR
jgi:alpha-ketoglutarate-dependent 2,4-dichlorophenoxyacetate dioxygenase